MSVLTTPFRDLPRSTDMHSAFDSRKHRRLPLTLSGRYMRSDRSEFTCEMKDVSVGGAAVLTPHVPEIGERVVAYFEHLGGVEGIVARLTEGGFAFAFKVTEHKREKLAAQIMWLINREDYPEQAVRLHERVGTRGRRTTLKVDDGVIIDVELLDLSASGASIGTPARPPIGSFVVAGKSRAIVRRHHEHGIGLQFLSLLSPEAMRESFP
ncbi:pilus assembly protein PilZ [Hyphomicrobium methylovorum]|uniref:PilZ domain-containing protein n=1 Tax=Hyphomicrobium methylovorum TaxID=84 RepID=UPI0015E7E070|nr:PilZ domain-containing protein [Hyphomicrobium methylovorum]MBA2124801.1 pilus assembly protein PilZ [Hyphomicrobium methylovorum]